uniref:Uncharacterized protein n=1 Tax=Nelumbo nucifera TaxID=4432 RepID=A0A822YUG9_NELNU|nr:TPA_asm: hypothetical protein HUJ06_006837 [Nelumbo nucifera]
MYPGVWTTYILILFFSWLVVLSLFGCTPGMAWTIVNLCHFVVSISSSLFHSFSVVDALGFSSRIWICPFIVVIWIFQGLGFRFDFVFIFFGSDLLFFAFVLLLCFICL